MSDQALPQFSRSTRQAIQEYDALVTYLNRRDGRALPIDVADRAAAAILIASRIDDVSDALIQGLPTAGEGI